MMQYLTFKMDDALYGINIYYVYEINYIDAYTAVPGARDTIHGFINLRGEIVTVFNLRRTLGLEDRPLAANAVNMTLKTEEEIAGLPVSVRVPLIGNDRAGFMTETVGDIITLDEDRVERTPPVDQQKYNIAFLSGVYQMEGEVLMILDIERLLSATALEGAVRNPG